MKYLLIALLLAGAALCGCGAKHPQEARDMYGWKCRRIYVYVDEEYGYQWVTECYDFRPAPGEMED